MTNKNELLTKVSGLCLSKKLKRYQIQTCFGFTKYQNSEAQSLCVVPISFGDTLYVQFTFQKYILFSLNGYQICIRIRGKINVKSNCLNIHREILKNFYQVPIVFTYWILDISKLIKNLGVQQVICSKSFGVC